MAGTWGNNRDSSIEDEDDDNYEDEIENMLESVFDEKCCNKTNKQYVT